ncbi:MAG TPA: FCD domain-containing protein [Clostridia bacterium]|nr:FCD domain-containing protein [Clostridia bacterium]
MTTNNAYQEWIGSRDTAGERKPMKKPVEPPVAVSPKREFIGCFEGLILSGTIAMGERLPPERSIAAQLGVSRPVVHEGLLELASRGLVTIRPRHGAVVNDYRTQGSVTMLASLVAYQRGELEPSLAAGLIDMRRLFETETARRAALNRTDEQIGSLRLLVEREKAAAEGDIAEVTRLDFQVHHEIALASGNPVYAMLMKSFEPAYTNLSGRFFAVPGMARGVVKGHEALVQLIEQRDAEGAVSVMRSLLEQGAKVLLGLQHAADAGRKSNGTD